MAKQRNILPDQAYDAGQINAASLSRGGAYAATQGSLASGSENPAALVDPSPNALFATAVVGTTSKLSQSTVTTNDPLNGKVLQYLSIGAQKGVLYFEPLGRADLSQAISAENPALGNERIKFGASAIGFAAADKLKAGSLGISLAYIHSELGLTTSTPGQPDVSSFDTGDGVRFNLGVRYPTGPAMWGLVLQNFPGFVWWKNYRRDMLPMKIRVGNTWHATSRIVLSLDAEQRFYHEGAHSDTYYFIGSEMPLSGALILRAGAFSNHFNQPNARHYTGGLAFQSSSGVELSYALERYKIELENVSQSFLTLRVPFAFDEQ